ncbi:MAG: glycosyltransferase family 2 protein [Mycobacteriales bacterium]
MSQSGRTVPAGTWLIIPVYNEATVLAEVLQHVLSTFDGVICVDDGSSDASVAVIRGTAAHLVSHPVNLGQGAAIQTGIEYALRQPGARYFVTFDSDGQHRVEDALSMLELLAKDEVDIVFGSRFLDDRTKLPALKRAVLKLAVRYENATSGIRLSDAHNGLRAFNRKVAAALALKQSGMGHASEIVGKVSAGGFRYAEVPVEILYTQYSRSKGQSVLNSVNIVFDLLFR